MSTPATPSAPVPAGKDRNPEDADQKVVGPSFEDRLRLFWQRNSSAVTGVLVAVLLAIVAKGGWEYFQGQREQEIGKAYAAATTPAQLKSFAATYPKHALAAAAQLRLADQAYAEGKPAEAIGLYELAVPMLEMPVLASRARLGLAMSKLQGGRVAEGETALRAFVNDEKEVKAFRAGAAYILASHGLATGKPEDVKTYSELLMQIDPASPWTQRVMMLRASAPDVAVTAPATPAASAPAITLPGSKK